MVRRWWWRGGGGDGGEGWKGGGVERVEMGEEGSGLVWAGLGWCAKMFR